VFPWGWDGGSVADSPRNPCLREDVDRNHYRQSLPSHNAIPSLIIGGFLCIFSL